VGGIGRHQQGVDKVERQHHELRAHRPAKEIKGLIDTSVQKVAVGSRLVTVAGITMAGIVSQVQKVDELIAGISEAASEQSSGIGQVNGAISQLDQVTQQNAVLVEQSAAAAENLRIQAERLTEAVSVFRTGAPQPNDASRDV
jgi:methyl-accepting chemotaxis protein